MRKEANREMSFNRGITQNQLLESAMLTIDQVIKIYEEGFDLLLKGVSRSGLKGELDPGTLEINIYQSNVDSEYDRDITILHEFIHARDEILPRDPLVDCSLVDMEAMQTYEENPHVLQYIKELFEVGSP